MNSVPADPLIGQTLDQRYVVRSRIARGGMAMVYLGNDLRLGRRVAIKVMHPHLADDEKFTRRFEQEARSSAVLAHPNVVNVFDQGEANGVPFLIMEHLPGITLRELLKQQRQLTSDQAIEIGEAVLAGLAAAHEAGIVHRDLKPENVLLADDGRIKIADFGLARAVSANTTTGQALLGTIAYLSPELVTRGIADARSDLYAFGIMLFEMLTGKQPYTGEQPMQIAYQHAHSDVPLPSTIEPDISPELDQLVRWTTQRDADARPEDAREAYEYLHALRTAGPLAATAVLPPTAVLGIVTPSTTVLGDTDQQAIIASLDAGSGVGAGVQSGAGRLESGVAVARARRLGLRRARRGRVLAAFFTLLFAGAAGAGFWWGQGPGSNVAVPDVTGLELGAAQQIVENLSLLGEREECPSLDVAIGHVVRTAPEAGERVERGSTVTLCESTGPRTLQVPLLVGLSLEEAQGKIEEAGFAFGEVVEQWFDGDTARGTVILALDADNEVLNEGDDYTEQQTIDLITSAGSLPEVTDLSVEAAVNEFERVGLSVDPELGDEAYSETINEGRVIGVLVHADPLRVGGSVGLEISLGPELFAVPEVAGMGLQEAMDALAAAGFEPTTAVPDALRGLARATGTSPAAGELVKAGTTIQVRATISL